MCDIRHQKGANFIAGLSESLVLKITGVTRRTTDYHSWLELLSTLVQGLIVDQTGLFIDEVWLRLEVETRSGDLLGLCHMSMSQVTSMAQTQAHELASRSEQCCVDREISW